jgi:hypothetical protein
VGDRPRPTTPPFEAAPVERITEHPDLLAEVVRDLCGWEPEDYAVSDESLLSDLVDRETDLAALYADVATRYGVTVLTGQAEPYLWQLIDQIATRRRGEVARGALTIIGRRRVLSRRGRRSSSRCGRRARRGDAC